MTWAMALRLMSELCQSLRIYSLTVSTIKASLDIYPAAHVGIHILALCVLSRYAADTG